jgi:hypothetical protein
MTQKPTEPKIGDQMRADWPVPTSEELARFQTIKDSEPLERELAAVIGKGLVEKTDNRKAQLDFAVEKGILSKAGRVLLEAADDARAELAKSPTFIRIGSEMPDGSIYIGISKETKRPMYMMAQEGPELNWYEAMKYAKALNAHGRNDWRLPQADETESLSGYFKTAASKEKNYSEPAGHWLGSVNSMDKAWLAHETTGQPVPADKRTKQPVRCIRYG